MKFLYYLLDVLSPGCLLMFWWQKLIGAVGAISIISVFFVSAYFLSWVYAIPITIGYILFAIGVSTIIEIIYKYRKRRAQDNATLKATTKIESPPSNNDTPQA